MRFDEFDKAIVIECWVQHCHNGVWIGRVEAPLSVSSERYTVFVKELEHVNQLHLFLIRWNEVLLQESFLVRQRLKRIFNSIAMIFY